MAEIKLFRIDSRLIHGQIITKWLKVSKADKIVVVDWNSWRQMIL